MIDLQIISKIINTKNFDIVKNNGLSVEFFPQYEEEFNYIFEHYKKYGNVPDKETFLTQFPEIKLPECREEEQYLVDGIREERLYAEMVPVIQKSADLLKQNSVEAVKYLQSQMLNLKNNISINAVDIVAGASDRLSDIKNKKEQPFFITTGFSELDEVLTGWGRGEELVTLVGRTNEGKSWLLLKMLIGAWLDGKRVGLYSGEMSALPVGYRFDSLYQHYSNTLLGRGDVDTIKYKIYTDNLKKKETPFFIITPEELGGPATASQMEFFCDKYKIDILGIDQYSLMSDERAVKNQPLRINYEHISKDLYRLSSKFKIPVVGAVQANRDTVKNKSNTDTMPRLENVAESDAIVQNSSKVLGLQYLDGVLTFRVLKNRAGRREQELKYYWDIDSGTFNFIPEYDDPTRAAEAQSKYKDTGDPF